MKKQLQNIYLLGVKELFSLWRDKMMVGLIVYCFTVAIYLGATATSSELHKAPIGFVDEDRSALSAKIIDSFYPPRFLKPDIINQTQVDAKLDAGFYTFIVVIPRDFEKDIISGKQPSLQVNIDATRMTQAGIGAGYIQRMINNEVADFTQTLHKSTPTQIGLVTRMKYNPNLTSSWFGGVMEIISQITLLSIILTGAALIREREHGTLEHLLVMPVNALEIMLAKIWSMSLVVLFAAAVALIFMVEGVLQVPIAGSEALFLFGSFLVLFATSSMGILMGTVAKTMPQLGLIFILIVLPLLILSGNITPYESMPKTLQAIMLLSPTTHYVSMAQAILYRGAGIDTVWPNMLAITVVGTAYFSVALLLFKRSLSSQS